MSTTRSLFNSAVARTGFTAIYAVISFFLMPFLVSHLGERWYGIWIVLTSLVANSYLLDMGMATAVSRYVAKALAQNDARAANQVISTCLVIYTVLAAVIVVLTLVLAAGAQHFIPEATDLRVVQATIIVIGLTYAAEFPFKSFAGIIGSYVRYDLLMLSRLLNVCISSGLMVYFVGHGYGILSMALIVLGADQISNFLYYRISKHLFRDLEVSRRHMTRGIVRELFSYSTWSFVIQIAGQLRFRKDSLVISALLSASSVTYYAVGLRLVEYLVDFVQKATNMVTPIFTRYFYERNFEEIRRKYLFLTRINAALGMFGGGMLIVLGDAFITRWMGPVFHQSYPVLVVLTTAMVVELIGIPCDNVLYAISKHKFLAVVNVIEALVNLALSIALAKPFGIIGVALGTAVPLIAFRTLVIPVYVGRTMGLSIWKYYRDLAPLVLYTAAFIAICGFVTRSFLEPPSYTAIALTGAVGSLIYALTVPYVGFSSEERAQLQDALPEKVRRFTAPLLGRRIAGQ